LRSLPKTEIKTLPISKLLSLRRNPQYLTERQTQALKLSIERDGFLVPVIVRPRGENYEILSGNHRVLASKEAGLLKLPCVLVRCSDAAAARIAVNMNTIHGEPSAELLAPFLAPLDDKTLKSLYIDGAMLAQLKDFDLTLKERLQTLSVPDKMDHAAASSPLPNCVCKCGNRHVNAQKPLKSTA
jgi:ParB family chromosome partitioning protein